MNVLLVGSGGREHALAWKLAQSRKLTRLFAAPGSPGIGEYADCVPIAADDHAGLLRFCAESRIAFAVIGPEAPLAAGLADALWAAGVPVFGPKQAAARLESSKAFAKDFMARHGVPAARSAVFTDPAEALKALPAFGLPVVVKADGLAAGKGVRVCATAAEADAAVADFMEGDALGGAGKTLLLEEFLVGRETTLMGFCDGISFLALPPSSDHKRLLDDDKGPNTGGMGVIAPTPEVTPEVLERIRREVTDKVLLGLQADKIDYRGILYCGIILTAAGPKVLEFNVRFGDPETQAVLPLLGSDLLDLMDATVRGNLSRRRLRWSGASVTVVLASEGYPGAPRSGRTISGLETETPPDVFLFHAGIKSEQGVWKTAGGRVLGVTAAGGSVAEARDKAYAAARSIRFDGMHYRKDIGATAVRVP